MDRLIVFGLLSLPLIYLSRPTLFMVKSHGFYRFLSWECILWLLVSDIRFWFVDAFCIRQTFSWIFLFSSVYLVVAGVLLLKKKGRPIKDRMENELFLFEKTSVVIDQGIFRYIRHPLYSSLLFLTWGIFLKHITVPLLFVAMASSQFLYLTAIFDELECIRYFGRKYIRYMKRTKRFIPFIF